MLHSLHVPLLVSVGTFENYWGGSRQVVKAIDEVMPVFEEPSVARARARTSSGHVCMKSETDHQRVSVSLVACQAPHSFSLHLESLASWGCSDQFSPVGLRKELRYRGGHAGEPKHVQLQAASLLRDWIDELQSLPTL